MTSEPTASRGTLGDRLLRTASCIAAWLLIYVPAGGLGLFVVSAHHTDEPTCLPFHTIGGLASNCPNEVVNLFWLVTLGIPSFLIELPALGAALALDAIRNGEPYYVLDGIGYWITSIPLFIVVILGFLRWKRTNPLIGWIALFALLAEILAMAFIA